MSIGGLLLLALVGGFCLAVALWPVIARRAGRDLAEEFGMMSTVTQLRAEREAVLQAVRELDFDFQTGKLVEDDYRTRREELMQRGVAILKQLEQRESEVIEAAIMAARGKS